MECGGRGGQHGPSYGPNVTKIASRELVQGLCVAIAMAHESGHAVRCSLSI
jgi:hypothetical protein